MRPEVVAQLLGVFVANRDHQVGTTMYGSARLGGSARSVVTQAEAVAVVRSAIPMFSSESEFPASVIVRFLRAIQEFEVCFEVRRNSPLFHFPLLLLVVGIYQRC